MQALRYGVTLFHYFQQDYFGALTELMAAQQLDQLDVHDDNAELLRAGMALSYGMDRLAEEIFVDLLGARQAVVAGRPADTDQAWFYLAKLAWQRGELDRASAALAQMSPEYRGSLASEANYLRAALSLRQGEQDLAAAYAEQLPEDSPWRYYHYYNSGAALAAGGEWAPAADYFGQFEHMTLRSAESKLLRDKAFTAAGYAQMAAGNWREAGQDFTRVRLESPLSARALLGYGWSFAQEGDYKAALGPWQKLSERAPLSESVRAGLLAIPYAYEQLGRHNLALTHYRQAASVYSEELTGIENAIEVFRSGSPDVILDPGSYPGGSWVSGEDILPRGEHTAHLKHLVSKNAFQLALRELTDLHQLLGHLSDARERLEVLAQVDADQQRSWSSVNEGDRLQQLTGQQQLLRDRITTLRSLLQAAETGGDQRWFADAEQSARWRRLGNAAVLSAKLDSRAGQPQLMELYQGMLIWEDNEQYSLRRRQVQKQLAELETLAGGSDLGIANVNAAATGAQQSSFMARIEILQQRVGQQREKALAAVEDSDSNIRKIAIAELEHQHRQLTRALGQSRLAIARIYDVASTEAQR